MSAPGIPWGRAARPRLPIEQEQAMRWNILRPALAGFVISMLPFAAMAEQTGFDHDAPGSVPGGWLAGVTGSGEPRWAVEADPSAPSPPHVLAQSGRGTFPWIVNPAARMADGFVEVKFRPRAGEQDQAAGLVWRWRDGGNYYVARANALENNVSLYYTRDGRRITLKYVEAPVSKRQWHTLRVDFSGDRIAVSLDGKTYIDLRDRHIAGEGAVGLWTKADSDTAFDDFAFGPPATRVDSAGTAR
jgi:hypothetical protein